MIRIYLFLIIYQVCCTLLPTVHTIGQYTSYILFQYIKKFSYVVFCCIDKFVLLILINVGFEYFETFAKIRKCLHKCAIRYFTSAGLYFFRSKYFLKNFGCTTEGTCPCLGMFLYLFRF